jgi:cbb3-type cytochrome oxidase subunit 1
LSKVKLIPYLVLVNSVAVVLGMAMVASREYLTIPVVLVVWILIAWAAYPLVVSFSVLRDEQA